MLKKVKKNNETGFTLIEVLVSMVLFAIAMVAIMPMFIMNIKYNEMNQKRLAAQKLVENTASEIKSINFYKFDTVISNLKSNLSNVGFTDDITSVSSLGYPAGGEINQPCPTGYEAKLYRANDLIKSFKINGVKTVINYKYTMKMCIDVDYIDPYLKKAILTCYWEFGKKLHKSSTEVFIAPKG